MTGLASEFSRFIELERLGAEPFAITVSADDEECAALARRFGWVGLAGLTAAAELTERAEGIDAKGQFSATLTQVCVATGALLTSEISQIFSVRFSGDFAVNQAEIELNSDDLDVIVHDGRAIDLGEAVAQTLALAVDPFPRAPDADAHLKAAGVLGEGEVGPFAGLKRLLKDG